MNPDREILFYPIKFIYNISKEDELKMAASAEEKAEKASEGMK